MAAQRPWNPAKMTGWYDPSQLVQTALQVAASTLFAQHADYRLLESLAAPDNQIYDYSRRQELWIDYIADLGDGWDSTYTVAYHAARPQLEVQAPGGGQQPHPEPLARGDILIFGGDEVYPVASRAGYDQRLLQPYERALPQTTEPHPHLFAIPGNHDWYDSLVSFTRLFCARRWFAGWKTRQACSYFALQLPHGWWLLGTDVQLASDIDRHQVEYFRRVTAHMQEGDRIILCNAEPHWIYAGAYEDMAPDNTENNLRFLEEKVLNRRVAVYVAGDLHHYRRHEAPDGRQKITCGGGGAFLHPTHGPNVAELGGGFTLRKSFPDEATSRRLCWGNLAFLRNNPKFGLVTAILYLLTGWTVMAPIGHYGLGEIGEALRITLETALNSPGAMFWAVTVFLGFALFTDTHSRVYRWVAGPLHGLSHLLATFFIGWAASWFTTAVLGLGFRSIPQLVAAGLLIAAGGWIAGSVIMGLYLLISLNGFDRHANEAFSALQIADWKSFLRLRIGANGDLTIYPIGFRTVSRKWTPGAESAPGADLRPADGSPAELIEPPLVVRGKGGAE